MKRTFTSALLALLVLSGIAEAQTPLRQSTSRVVRICGAVAIADGITPVTTLSLGAADEAEVLRDNTATLDISGATFAAVTGADGCYSLTLDTTATNTVGELVVVIQDDSLILPIEKKYQVYEEAVYDRDFAAAATGNSARVALALPNAAPDAAGGLPISDAGGLDLDALNTNINDIETDTADMQPKLGTFPNLGTGATLAANLEDMRDNGTAAYDRTTDCLQCVRDRGDAAWATGGGGTNPLLLQNTTIASLASQTSFTLTAGSADNSAYADRAIVVVTDQSTSTQKAIGRVCTYTGASRTVGLCEDPGVFTMAVGDTVDVVAATSFADVLFWLNSAATALIEEDSLVDAIHDEPLSSHTTAGTTGERLGRIPNAAPGGNGGLPTVNASNQVAGVSGNVVGSVASVTGNVGGNVVGSVASVTGNVGGNVVGSVASVTGNVGGNVTGSVGSVAANGITDTSLAASAVTEIQNGLATSAALTTVDQNVDDIEAGLAMHMLLDTAFLNCEVNTANFAGSTTTLACVLTDRGGTPVTQATGDLEGLQLVVTSGDQIREQRFITDSTWDGGNSELRLTLSRALPGTLADAVTAIIR